MKSSTSYLSLLVVFAAAFAAGFETMTGGVAVLDFDNDGWLDVFFVNGARLKNPQPDGEVLDKSAPAPRRPSDKVPSLLL
jgi:hypothetical protein